MDNRTACVEGIKQEMRASVQQAVPVQSQGAGSTGLDTAAAVSLATPSPAAGRSVAKLGTVWKHPLLSAAPPTVEVQGYCDLDLERDLERDRDLDFDGDRDRERDLERERDLLLRSPLSSAEWSMAAPLPLLCFMLVLAAAVAAPDSS